jgi:hypothetical protein
MEQQTKEQYIAHLMSAPWQDIKDEAELYGVEKDTDDKWKDLIPAIADAKFAAPVLTEEDQEFLDAELVEEEIPTIQPDEPIKEPEDEVLRFDYVRQGVLLVCQHCGYQIQTGLGGDKICPVSEPKCPRPSPNEVY